MGQVLSDLLLDLRSKLYVGGVQRVVHRLGVNRYLSDRYWTIVYALASSVQTHRIADHAIDFRVDTFAEFQRFRDLAGERPVLEDLLASIDATDTFYDVGANVGTYTCFVAAKLGPDRTVAFEPVPENVGGLRDNLELNDLDAQIVELALSDADGTVSMRLSGSEAGEGEHAIANGGNASTIANGGNASTIANGGNASTIANGGNASTIANGGNASTTASPDGANTIVVEAARGDSVLRRRPLPAPTVIKIDVEGAELSVLRGFRETLRDHVRLVYLEVHPERIVEFGGTVREVRRFLRDAGFDVTEISHPRSQTFLRASKAR